ncbi:hypothetical protein HYX70_03125 [Candidatus Saccharibacteria bacterium]|nr:hypothetical protein [Candidatus Saccharibacteria bacterium]
MRQRAESSIRYALYFNGLERTHTGVPERVLTWYYRLWGIVLAYFSVDWHSGRSFQELLDEATNRAEGMLLRHGQLVLIGASAGGSLAMGVFAQLRRKYPEADVRAVSLSGRLHVGNLDDLVATALHRPGKKPSVAFIDSVRHCNEEVLPLLTAADKQRAITFRPLFFDEAVPLCTMGISGVAMFIAPIVYHVPGIVLGALRIPWVLPKT